MRSLSLLKLIILCLVLGSLAACSEPETEQVSDSSNSTTAHYLRETTGAEECYITYKDVTRSGDSLRTIYVEIVNAKASVEQLPIWRSATIAACEFLYDVGESKFLEYDAIEIKFTHKWDESIMDSSLSNGKGMATREVVLADSIYRSCSTIFDNTEGSGFIKSRALFEKLISDSVLISMDSARLEQRTLYGPSHDRSFGGFETGTFESGERALKLIILEPHSEIILEHTITYSQRENKIIGWSCRQY